MVPPLDPEVAAAIDKIPSIPDNLTFAQIRVGAKMASFSSDSALWQRENAPPEDTYKVEDRMIPVNGAENLARIVIPTRRDNDKTETYPLMVWFHGGGFCLGSVDMDDYFLRKLSVQYRVVIVNIEYRLAPENPFPIGINDAYEGLKWAAENCSSFNASPSLGFIVGGCSSGANFTASTVLRARDDPFFSDRPITGQFLQLPSLIHSKAEIPERHVCYKPLLRSMSENLDAPLLGEKEIVRFTEALKADPNDPRFSVLLASSHKNLPPAYIQVAEADPLRDHGLLYEKVLKDEGVKTKLDRYPGYPHGAHYVLPRITLSQKFYKDFENGLEWLLQ